MTAIQPETITATGGMPESRVKDARSARDIVSNLFDQSRKRLQRWSMIDRMFDGGPPYDPNRLRNAGQAARSNVPTLKGKAILSAATTPFYDLFRSSATYASILLNTQDPLRAPDASRCASEAFHEVLFAWTNFHFRMWPMLNDFTRHGRGFQVWPMGPEWKSRWVRHSRVFVREATEMDMDDIDEIVVHQDLTVSMLWEKIRNAAASRRQGWSIGVCKEAIRNAAPNRDPYDNPINLEDMLRDNDLWLDSTSKRIRVAHLFIKEFSGQWTHMIVDRDGAVQEFMFKRTNAFEQASHFFAPFFFEVMNGSFNGATGLGKDILDVVGQGDRLWNSIMDGVFLRAGVNLQASDASSLRRLSAVQLGGSMNVWPPGFNALNATVLGDLQGPLAVMKTMDDMVEQNTGIYRPRIEKSEGNPQTATETQLRYAQATVLQSSAVDRFYVQLDRYYAEVWRRMVSTKEGRASLIDKDKSGVLMDADLRREAVVRATRALGAGSPASRQQAVFGLSSLAGSLPEVGRQRWMDDAIAVTAGQPFVDRYNPKGDKRTQPSEQTWEAVSENADLSTGAPAVRYAGQNDFVHAETHLGFSSQAAKSLESGADPVRVLGILDNIGKHTAIHLSALQSDNIRKSDVKQLMDLWKQLASVADKLRAKVKQQAQQQAQDQAKAAQQNGKGQMGPMMVDAAEKKARLDLDREIAQGKLQIEQQRMSAKIQMDQAKAQSDIANRRAQTEANLQEDKSNE
jgi:hypothetical protein